MPITERRFRTAEEGFHYIESFTNLERSTNRTIRSYRLDRMRALLEVFGNPHQAVRTIHIAGTKGKGSTGIYLASLLAESGLRTGFYASPHVSSYTERITLAGEPLEEKLYREMISRIATRLDSLDKGLLPAQSAPTTFELLTLLGFLLFREIGCDWAVIETGIGGRLDATNVVSPVASVLTPVQREHVELLGTTLPQIAGEKAGIIKPGVPAFSGYQHPDVRRVFEKSAELNRAPIRFLADSLQSVETRLHPQGSEVDFHWAEGNSDSFELAMAGEVQAENAALALLTLRSLAGGSGGDASPPWPTREVIDRAFRRARLPGRMEVFQAGRAIPGIGTPPAEVVLDAAHTPASVARLLDSFREIYPQGGVLIFGSILGKDPDGMAEALAPAFHDIVISTPGTFKKSDPAGVWKHFAARNPRAQLVPEPRAALTEAVRSAAEAGSPILVTGSFYMVAEIRALLLAR